MLSKEAKENGYVEARVYSCHRERPDVEHTFVLLR